MKDSDFVWLKQVGSDCRLSIHVQAGAKSDAIVGQQGSRLKIRIRSQRIEGMANAHLIEFLAETLSLSKK